ncbi:MAG: choice-of-anchor J domain-containing protein [Archangiaceae bacterium]|nr:choice-of-anchor J domain-containing protein [Archangiaceae bacterium]
MRQLVSLLCLGCACSSPTARALAEKVGQALGTQQVLPEVEPNGATAAALVLPGHDAVVRGNVKPVADTDYYRFTAAVGDRVFAATVTSGSSANGLNDTVLELVASDGTTVLERDDDDGSFADRASSLAGCLIPAAGDYFLRVSAVAQVRPYDLHFHLQRGAPVNEVEPNEGGQPLAGQGLVNGALASVSDVDTFAVSVNAGDTVFASLDLDPERDGSDWAARLSLRPTGAGGGWLASGSTGPGPHSLANFLTVKKAGTVLVSVDAEATGFGNYTLGVSIHPATAASGQCSTFASTAPLSFSPGNTVTSSIVVPTALTVADVDVGLSITHRSLQDLRVALTAPGGNVVGPLGGLSSTTPSTDFAFDEQAALLPVRDGVVSQPNPASRLHWLDGQPGAGTWSLSLANDSTFSGTLDAWALTLCARPAFVCPGGAAAQPVARYDFEAGAQGWSHSGTLDSWALGFPGAGPIASCGSGSSCWKTNLTGNYPASSSADLVSPPIALPATGTARVTWSMKYQLESDDFDHARVVVREQGGGNARTVWEWHDATMTGQSAGWATFAADLSGYAGKTVELVFVLDADAVNQLAGLAVDDVAFTACPPSPCGNGALDTGEQCDLGALNGQRGACCAVTCQFVGAGTSCRSAAGACDLAESCTGASPTCPADGLQPNGSTCDDGNPCTSADACQAGACSGAAVGCAAPDGCHFAGTCSPATGCAYPARPDGSLCDDTNACTATDTCQAGACQGGSPKTCAAADACHVAGVCAPATGLCSSPPASDGTLCDDSDPCTQRDACTAGTCAGLPISCTALDTCHAPGTCDPSNGVCSQPVKADGAACDDGDACTTADTCSGGACLPGPEKGCTALDSCHLAGTCDPLTGGCSSPAKGDGAGCNDANACTRGDVCMSGVCVGGAPLLCPARDDCHLAGACDQSSGSCLEVPRADGSACDGGTCRAGACATGGAGGGAGAAREAAAAAVALPSPTPARPGAEPAGARAWPRRGARAARARSSLAWRCCSVRCSVRGEGASG